jgi:sulfur transfer complex TusBCD TusB component (DsrH family)
MLRFVGSYQNIYMYIYSGLYFFEKKNRDHSKLLCFMAAENVLEVILLKEGVNALVTEASAASR